MQIYWNKRKRLHKKKSSTPKGLVWDTKMAAVSLFWETNMAAVTSCENTLLSFRVDENSFERGEKKKQKTVVPLAAFVAITGVVWNP